MLIARTKATQLTADFLDIFTQVERMSRRERESLLHSLCNGYANANFGHQRNRRGQKEYTLDEGEQMKFLADFICRTMGMQPFNHYALEEIYRFRASAGEDAPGAPVGLLLRPLQAVTAQRFDTGSMGSLAGADQ